MQIPFLDLSRVTAPLREQLHEAASRVIDSGWFLRGCETEAFESELAYSCGAPHCVAVSNGLDALRLILKGYIALGRLSPGDEVIVAANTYIASILAIDDCGLIPVLVEPDPVTLNLDPSRIEHAITPRSRALMVVHLYGRPCWNSEIKRIAREHDLLVIEDNAQAIGAQASCTGTCGEDYCGSSCTGALGHAAAFSFYPTKNIGALGDSGAVTTHDAELAEAVRAMANYGSDRRYHNIYRGYNCRMDEIHAAMLRVKLRHLPRETERRNTIARIYSNEIKNDAVTLPPFLPGERHVWHQYVILCEQRDLLQQYLQQEGIGTDIHYAVPPHRQPCYSGKLGPSRTYPLTEKLARCVLSLPIGSATEQEAHEVARAISNFNA